MLKRSFMKNIKVSIIVPIFNAENFLSRCLNSLINQSLRDLEIILINDGSLDQSLAICKEFQQKDQRIRIINNTNNGVSFSRNIGIEKALGEYIGFVDADDYIKSDFYETLYRHASKNSIDITTSITILGRDNKNIIKSPVFKTNTIYNQEFNQTNIIENLLTFEDLFPIWNKLYDKNFIVSNTINFPINETSEEDAIFNIKAFNVARRTLFIDYAGYYYCEVAESASRNFIKKDLYRQAVHKFNLEYKKELNLSLSSKEINRLKSVKLINRAVYLVFICSTIDVSFKEKNNYIKMIVKDPLLLELLKKYSKDEKIRTGKFDKLIHWIMKKQSMTILNLVIFVISKVYTPSLSEFIRKINK